MKYKTTITASHSRKTQESHNNHNSSLLFSTLPHIKIRLGTLAVVSPISTFDMFSTKALTLGLVALLATAPNVMAEVCGCS